MKEIIYLQSVIWNKQIISLNQRKIFLIYITNMPCDCTEETSSNILRYRLSKMHSSRGRVLSNFYGDAERGGHMEIVFFCAIIKRELNRVN